MRRGVDTTFLVQLEVAEHPGHDSARSTLAQLLDAGDRLVLTTQVLAEFVHVVTDGRRFSQPLTMEQSLARAEH